MSIQVDKGIPIPKPSLRGIKVGQKLHSLPWNQMDVGDSFIFPCKQGANEARHRAAARISSKHKISPKRYLSRTLKEQGRRIVRIWRVA